MEIKFIDFDKKEEDINIDLDDIIFSKNNPRFTLVKSFEENLISFLASKKEDNQKKIFKKLLLLEGDFQDLKRLLENIRNIGFDNSIDPLYLIKDKENNIYTVAEGNRRLMCLKLIFGKFKFYDFTEIIDYISTYSNISTENIYDEDDKEEEVRKPYENKFKVYSECIEILKEIIDQDNHFKIHCKIVDNSEDLWKIIYDKHLTGERPGMRNWSRSKYFADLLNGFSKGISNNSNEQNKIFENINRNKDIVIKDFKEAQFVYYCVFYGKKFDEINDERKIINDNDDLSLSQNVLNYMVEMEKVSALERTHSFSKIRKILCESILFINNEQFSNDYFKISFDKKNNIIFFNEERKINKKSFLSFIFTKWLEGDITTRPIKDRNKMIAELRLLLNQLDVGKVLTKEELYEIDEFNLTVEMLDILISLNENYHDKNEMNRFHIAKQMKENANYFIKKLGQKIGKQNIEPIYVFDIIKKQLAYNMDQSFLNAVAVSIRSFIEQIYIWVSWDENEEYEFEKNYLKELATGRIDIIFHSLRKADKKIFMGKIESFLKKDENYESNKDFLDKIVEEDKGWRLLNSFIHASHRMYIDDNYNENLNTIEKIFENCINVHKALIFNNFQNLNTRIINLIKNSNDENNNKKTKH